MFLAFGPSFCFFSSMDFLHVRDTGYFFLMFTTENEAMSQSVLGTIRKSLKLWNWSDNFDTDH